MAGLVGVREERDAVVLSFDRMEGVENERRAEALSFETESLAPGTYRVDVTVIDQLAGDARAERSVEVTVVD